MSDQIIKFGISTLFTQITSNNDVHIEFLDPICTVLKLCVLNFKNQGTKISIKNNKIDIQDNNILQSCIRMFNNDNRDQLFQLKLPLYYFKGLLSKFILVNDLDIDYEDLEIIKNIAINGLQKLKTTYELSKKSGSLIRNSIDEYIRILKHNYNKDEFMIEISDLIKTNSLFLIYAEFLKYWKDNDIKIIIKLINIIIENINTNSISLNNYIICIDNYITAKDKEIDKVRPD